MSTKPILTVVIPVYNAENYIEKCISSILKQGFAEHELEIVCIDDGSSDSSATILNALAEMHSNIYVFHQENSGVSAARNKGMKYISGEYFEFVDADDYLIENQLKQICNSMKENKCSVACMGVVNETYAEIDNHSDYVVGEMLLSGFVTRYIFSAREFKHIQFDEEIRYGEDTLFSQEVRLHNPRCLCVNVAVYVHINNPKGIMGTRNFSQSADSMLRMAKHHQNFLINQTFPNETKKIVKWKSRCTAAYIYYRLRAGDDEYPFAFLKAQNLWPYPCEWNLLRIRLKKPEERRQMIANWLYFLVGFRPLWYVFAKTKLLTKI